MLFRLRIPPVGGGPGSGAVVVVCRSALEERLQPAALSVVHIRRLVLYLTEEFAHAAPVLRLVCLELFPELAVLLPLLVALGCGFDATAYSPQALYRLAEYASLRGVPRPVAIQRSVRPQRKPEPLVESFHMPFLQSYIQARDQTAVSSARYKTSGLVQPPPRLEQPQLEAPPKPTGIVSHWDDPRHGHSDDDDQEPLRIRLSDSMAAGSASRVRWEGPRQHEESRQREPPRPYGPQRPVPPSTLQQAPPAPQAANHQHNENASRSSSRPPPRLEDLREYTRGYRSGTFGRERQREIEARETYRRRDMDQREERLSRPRFQRDHRHGATPPDDEEDEQHEECMNWDMSLLEFTHCRCACNVELHFLTAETESTPRTGHWLNKVVELLTELRTAHTWLVICPTAETVDEMVSHLIAIVSGRDPECGSELRRPLRVRSCTELSTLEQQVSFLTREMPSNTLWVTTHVLLDMAPSHFPPGVDVVVDAGVTHYYTVHPWAIGVEYQLTVKLSRADLTARVTAASEAKGLTQYFVCLREEELVERERISTDLCVVMYALLNAMGAPTKWTVPDEGSGRALPTFAPIANGLIAVLQNVGVIYTEADAEGRLDEPVVFREYRLRRFEHWLAVMEDVALAALMTVAEDPRHECAQSAAGICAMIRCAPHPYVKQATTQDLRLAQCMFSVQEGDAMTLGNILYEVARHGRDWARRRGLNYEQVMAAHVFAESLALPDGADRPENLVAALQEAWAHTTARLVDQNRYCFVTSVHHPDDGGSLPQTQDIALRFAEDSAAHLSSPETIVFHSATGGQPRSDAIIQHYCAVVTDTF